MRSVISFLLLSFVLHVAQGAEEYRYGNMTMYLARAGGLKWALKSEVMLKPNARIKVCPTDYKRGFTIRCEPTVPFPRKLYRVEFYVNNKFNKNEYVVPYYLAGNNEKRVRAYYFGNRNYLKIECMAKNVQSATVVIRKDCPPSTDE